MYSNLEPSHSEPHQWNCPSWCGLNALKNTDWNQVELCKQLLSDKQSNFKQLHFGRHKNNYYRDLVQNDTPFCVWLLSQSWLEDFDKGVILVHLLDSNPSSIILKDLSLP